MGLLLADFTIPENFLFGVLGTIIFGLIGVVLLLLAFKVFDYLTSKLDIQEQLNKDNRSVAIVLAALFVAIGVVVASVIR